MPWPFSKPRTPPPPPSPPPALELPFIQYRLRPGTLVTGHPEWVICISWLHATEVQTIGLPPEAQIAVMKDASGPFDESNVRGAAAYPDFLQSCMPEVVARHPTLPAIAKRFGDGVMHIPDAKGHTFWSQDPAKVALPEWANIGHVHVRAGVIDSDSYIPNAQYRGFRPGSGALGLSYVPDAFYPTLLGRLRALRGL
jgi:hypothetical protein